VAYGAICAAASTRDAHPPVVWWSWEVCGGGPVLQAALGGRRPLLLYLLCAACFLGWCLCFSQWLSPLWFRGSPPAV